MQSLLDTTKCKVQCAFSSNDLEPAQGALPPALNCKDLDVANQLVTGRAGEDKCNT